MYWKGELNCAPFRETSATGDSLRVGVYDRAVRLFCFG